MRKRRKKPLGNASFQCVACSFLCIFIQNHKVFPYWFETASQNNNRTTWSNAILFFLLLLEIHTQTYKQNVLVFFFDYVYISKILAGMVEMKEAFFSFSLFTHLYFSFVFPTRSLLLLLLCPFFSIWFYCNAFFGVFRFVNRMWLISKKCDLLVNVIHVGPVCLHILCSYIRFFFSFCSPGVAYLLVYAQRLQSNSVCCCVCM